MDFNATTAYVAASGDTYSAISIAVPTVATVVALLSWLLWPTSLDPREPPLVNSRIPFVGHLIGILWYHQRYYEVLRYIRFYLGGLLRSLHWLGVLCRDPRP
jgi:hypothetical protein